MKNKYTVFANLFDLLQDAEEELGIENLTNKDKLILREIISNKNEDNLVNLKYSFVKENFKRKSINISRAQFFKSISTLLKKKIILKVGLERSCMFKLKS